MSNQEILTKAIEKAIPAGWSEGHRWRRVIRDNNWVDVPVNEIIFNHDFAKALWGDTTDPQYVITDALTGIPHNPYKWHLQQMVIADDPIKYLGENI